MNDLAPETLGGIDPYHLSMRIPNTGRAWRPRSLPGVTLFEADLTDHRFPAHIHNEIVIGVSERGRHRAWRRGEEIVVSPTCVSMVMPEEVHAANPMPGAKWIWRSFHLAPEVVEEVVGPSKAPKRTGTSPLSAPAVAKDRELASTLLDAHRALERDQDSQEGRRWLTDAVRRLFQLSNRSRDAPDGGNADDPRVRRCRQLIERRFREPLTLDKLARTARTSPSHLVRIFRAQVGLTPYDYLILVRVREAQERLAAGWKIAAAAHEVGFADQSHLHRHFKRRLGVTPGAFRS